MRVILKPAGLVLVLLAFGGLAGTAAFQRATSVRASQSDDDIEKLSRSLAARIRTPPVIIVGESGTSLVGNPGFEGGFEEVGKRESGRGVDTTHRGGAVAFPWRDDSDWADVSVAYAKETGNPHSGKACQRVMVQAVRSGAVQVVQEVATVRGATYDVSCWFKSDRPLSVEVGLRQGGGPFKYYGEQKAQIGTEWKQVTVRATVSDRGNSLFIIKLLGPSNLLMDDADITVAKLPSGAKKVPGVR